MLLRSNSIYYLRPGVPAFIAQGVKDEIVRPASTIRFVRNVCGGGNPVQLLMLRGADHSSSASASAIPAVSWLRDRFFGKPAPTSCR